MRLPQPEAELLSRRAFERRTSKRDLVTTMVQQYLGAQESPGTPAHERGLDLGRHEFRSAEQPEVLTLEQAADLLQVGADVLAGLAERREVPARRIGSDWRFSRTAVLQWLGDVEVRAN